MDAVQAQGAFALADPSCLHVTEVRDAGAVGAPPSSPREPASLLACSQRRTALTSSTKQMDCS